MPTEKPQQLTKLLELVREAVERDDALRKQYKVGDKFRFVNERLQELLKQIESKFAAAPVESKTSSANVSPTDEVVVYVYLYNAQGLVLRNWRNMLTPKVFYEYSVNRPIYTDKNQIQSLVRSKTNKAQHAYITVLINRSDLVPTKEGMAERTDPLGNPVARVKEGSLDFSRLVQFTHNEQDYILGADGELVKKES